jgi:hypothetical protein
VKPALLPRPRTAGGSMKKMRVPDAGEVLGEASGQRGGVLAAPLRCDQSLSRTNRLPLAWSPLMPISEMELFTSGWVFR